MVVNLTKHIHIKSSGNNEEVDCDEYAQYFPSFMWIVRDFTLQLVDEDEENINSNQYLEKALEEQKGFSDKIEEKNRIRRLIKSFFKERQCFTMIRPVTDEEALQNLDQMSEDDFRPDFLEQVKQLRKKVTHCVKPKLLSGKQLSPPMFLSLAENYITAINKGAVPNIENAWTYICQNESKKSLEKAVIHFDDDLNQNILYSLPMEESDLKDWYRDIRAECKDIFFKSCVGEVIKEHIDELKFQLDMKFEKVLQENERECGNSCMQFLDTEYIQIENKVKNDNFQDFYEYESELQAFKETYFRDAPPGPCRNEYLLSFINDKLIDSIDCFIKRFTNQLEVQKQLSAEQERSLRTQIEELKEMRNQDRDETDQKVTKLSRELAQVKATQQSLEESRKTEQECFTQREKELKEKLKKEKIENDRKLEILKSKEEDARNRENQSKQIYMSEQNEYVKEKALLSQQVEYLTKNLEEQKQREERLKQENEQERESHLQTIRARKASYEGKISELAQDNDKYKEDISELEEKINQQQREFELQIEELETQANSNGNNDVCSSEEYLQLKETLEDFEQNKQEEIEEMMNSFKEVKDQLTARIAEAEEDSKKWEATVKNERNNFEKDKAILSQKFSFMTDKIETLTSKLDEKEKETKSMLELIGKNENEADTVKELEFKFQQYKSDADHEKDGLYRKIETMRAEFEEKETDFNDKI